MNEILARHDFGSCQNLATNELGGWFLACQDVHRRALNREYKPKSQNRKCILELA